MKKAKKAFEHVLAELKTTVCTLCYMQVAMSSVEQNSKLREEIEEKVSIKNKMGWYRVHYELEEKPFCEKRSKLVKLLFCTKHRF